MFNEYREMAKRYVTEMRSVVVVGWVSEGRT